METCGVFCVLFGQINWLWYVLAVVATFLLGAAWYSLLFPKQWMKVFKVEMDGRPSPGSMFFTMSMQLVASALLGLGLTMAAIASVWLAVLLLVGFCGWQKASLKFRYARWKDYRTAAMIEAGHTFLAGMIYILFALI